MGLSLGTASDGIKDETKRCASSISTPQIRRLTNDPRSPSIDIVRTPIEVLRTPSLERTLQQEQIDLDPRSPTTAFNRTLIVLNPESKLKTNTASETPVKPITPILLETSTKIVKHVENKRNSFVGLLETNMDFVETDLDGVSQSKVKEKELIECDDLPTKLSVVEELLDIKDPDELVEELLDIKGPDELELSVNKCVEELDRKLTDLIYEDKEFEIKTTLSKAKENNRTPLGDRHINQHYERKTIPILKVSDKPTRLVKNSRIPLLKEKKIKGQNQCENTPPRMVTNRSHWSTEDSLII